MKTEFDAFREFLGNKGMRFTPEREAILDEVFAEHEHFDVEELIMRLRQKGQRSSRASVYRTLALLVESGLVQEVFYEDGHNDYEHIYGHEHHCHLRCLGCRRLSNSATAQWRRPKNVSVRSTILMLPDTAWKSRDSVLTVGPKKIGEKFF